MDRVKKIINYWCKDTEGKTCLGRGITVAVLDTGISPHPDLKGRIDVLKVHSKDVRMDETVDLEAIALATSGAVGSDLANMINEAAINAVKHGRNAVSQSDLFEAVEVVLVGKEKKDRIMSRKSEGSFLITKLATRW